MTTVLRTPEDRFSGLPDFPFAQHYMTVTEPGLGPLRMHYVDEGDRDGRVVALVHGEPTWSFMFRRTVPPLVSAGYRVIVPDLIGFGRSDKPSRPENYTYDSHVRWLGGFFGGLAVKDVVLLGHDWGGLLGLRLATEAEGLVGAYIAANHGYPSGDIPANQALRTWQEYAASVPELDVGAIVARSCATPLPPEVVAAYDAPYPDESYKAGARRFPALIPVIPDDPASGAVRASRAVLQQSTLPFATIYGEQDPIAGAADAMFQQLVPGANSAPHIRLPSAGHNMPEDAGERLGEIIAEYLSQASPHSARRSGRTHRKSAD
jgi:haloalkane dehalogenase